MEEDENLNGLVYAVDYDWHDGDVLVFDNGPAQPHWIAVNAIPNNNIVFSLPMFTKANGFEAITEQVEAIKITPEGFFWMGELTEDKDVYTQFKAFLAQAGL